MALSAAEQFEIELINRARLDPLAEAQRYHLDLNANLAAGTISTAAKQVLSPNDRLANSADLHSQWMIATSTFSHTGINGSDPGSRMTAAGYSFNGRWSWGENLAWYGTTGRVDLEASIADHHQRLYESEHHRATTFGTDFREIGIGQVGGRFTYGSTTYNSSLLTQNYALSGDNVFVTGVAYRDGNANAFYGIGEGLGGVRISSGSVADTTETAGGYGIGVRAGSAVAVNVTQGSTSLATLTLDLTPGNGKLDVVQANNGSWSLSLSASAHLMTGIDNANLLGVANLNLTGSDDANRLFGNKGHNILSGGAGNDSLSGGLGNDRLSGDSGSDALNGGSGNDQLNGGAGNDRLSGGSGIDQLNGGSGRDQLNGGSGNDRLCGDSGNDRVQGGSGNDTITGGQGADQLTGNAGSDRFVFRAASDSRSGAASRDIITDFTHGQDKIDLSALDSNARQSGDQAFSFIGKAEFSHAGPTASAAGFTGQIRQAISTAEHVNMLEIDFNRDGISDMQIQLLNCGALTSSDFIL